MLKGVKDSCEKRTGNARVSGSLRQALDGEPIRQD